MKKRQQSRNILYKQILIVCKNILIFSYYLEQKVTLKITMAEDLGACTPNFLKRLNTEMDHSPVGTFSLSDISSLMDQKLQPILDQLGNIPNAAKLEKKYSYLKLKTSF